MAAAINLSASCSILSDVFVLSLPSANLAYSTMVLDDRTSTTTNPETQSDIGYTASCVIITGPINHSGL